MEDGGVLRAFIRVTVVVSVRGPSIRVQCFSNRTVSHSISHFGAVTRRCRAIVHWIFRWKACRIISRIYPRCIRCSSRESTPGVYAVVPWHPVESTNGTRRGKHLLHLEHLLLLFLLSGPRRWRKLPVTKPLEERIVPM